MALEIKSLTLKNFRNFESLYLSNFSQLNIIVGPNAIGKTNILEAIQLTTTLQPFENATNEQLILWGEDFGYIENTIQDSARDLKIKLEVTRESKKFSQNEKKKQSKDLKRILPAVVFTPDDLTLIKGPQKIKRKELDTFGSKVSLNYHSIKKDYEKILQHKNKILKEEQKCNREVLAAINETLLTTGSQFFQYRRELQKKLTPYIQKHYSTISKGKEIVEIKYIPSWETESTEKLEETREEILQFFCEALKREESNEAFRQHALVGPHADKIEYYIDGKNAALFGSQGQQRSLVLSLKLAEAEVIQDIIQQKPVLLLDDVMSELDSQRREALLDFIQKDIQTFITTTHLDYFPKEILNKANVIYPLKEKDKNA